MLRFLACALLAASANAFVASRAPLPSSTRAAASPSMLLSPDQQLAAMTLLAEVIDSDGERIYGAVDAPGWVAPVGALAAIGTALIPVLLAPGQEAFEGQRVDEQKVRKNQRVSILNRSRKDGKLK